MIKITLTHQPESQSYTFFKKEILIGSNPTCDLSLTDADIKPEHIKIEEEKDRFIIRNLTNDPFATLNELPFGKRILKDQDVLQIGEAIFLFEGTLTSKGRDYKEFPVVSTKGCLDTIVDQAIERTSIKQNFEISEKSSTDMESFLEEGSDVEQAFTHQQITHNELEETNSPPSNPPTQHKLPVILDFNDEDPLPFKQNEHAEGKKHFDNHKIPLFRGLSNKIKIIGLFLLLGLMIFITIAISAFWNFSKEGEKKVIQVARGVADIAVGMTYAKIHHIMPQQHNWSNPQFLKSHIALSLSPYHFSNLKLENNGKIHEDYLLRIYTNLDNSRFIIIAQPEPSVFHYFTVPDSIVVDSSSMNLHRINDLKALNRLLIDPEQLHSPGTDEIAQIIHNSPLIPIKSLSDEFNINGFKPPDSLHIIRPGSENFIHNSPRYTQIGEKIINDVIDITTSPHNYAEVRKMKELISSISKLPAPVIYTTKGKEHAQEAKTILSTNLKESDLIVAYVEYDPKTQAITSHLVDQKEGNTIYIEGEETTLARASAISYLSEATPYRHTSQFDKDPPLNPLYAKLNELSNKRKVELLAIQNDLQTMIEKEIEEPGTSSVKIIRNVAESLTSKMEELNVIILKELHQLYGQNKNIPLSEFLQYVEKSGLRSLANNELFPKQKTQEPINYTFTDEEQESLNDINKAINFETLFLAIDRASAFLSTEQSEDPQLIMSYQNQVKGRVIEKLNELILFKPSDLDADEYNEVVQDNLLLSLKKSWIVDKDEQNFYLSEFILRIPK